MSGLLSPDEFWPRVDVRPDLDSCWLYREDAPGALSPSGHVRICIGRGLRAYAHVYSFVLTYGVRPPMVAHRCDVPRCQAPWHLEPANAKINVAARERRNRRTPYLKKAPQHHSSRLTQADADEIRQAHREGVRVRTLVEVYDASETTVRAILRGERYVDVVPEITAIELSRFSTEERQSR